MSVSPSVARQLHIAATINAIATRPRIHPDRPDNHLAAENKPTAEPSTSSGTKSPSYLWRRSAMARTLMVASAAASSGIRYTAVDTVDGVPDVASERGINTLIAAATPATASTNSAADMIGMLTVDSKLSKTTPPKTCGRPPNVTHGNRLRNPIASGRKYCTRFVGT